MGSEEADGKDGSEEADGSRREAIWKWETILLIRNKKLIISSENDEDTDDKHNQ